MSASASYTGLPVGQERFARTEGPVIQRSVFDRSSRTLTAFDSGYIVPIWCDEALPGDTFSLSCDAFVRMSTSLKPLMDSLYLDFFFFAVPYRILWANFQKFCGEQENPGDPAGQDAYSIPQVTVTPAEESLYDYLGWPIGVSVTASNMWGRAYNMIYREWFRDQDLVSSPTVDTDDGPDQANNYTLLRRMKRHDYFTSARPFLQKGAAVTLPLGTRAEVASDANIGADLSIIYSQAGLPPAYNDIDSSTPNAQMGSPGVPGNVLFADLSQATAATINQLREAFSIQRLLERDARGGTRYVEIIRSHFGIPWAGNDARLQRPEFLGGGSGRINANVVAATNGLSQFHADLAAFGTGGASGVGFHKSFTEHCVLLGLVNIRSDLTYQQGLPRMFSREDRYDHYWPAFSHLGEQAVLSKEIYVDGTGSDEDVWGYQERWAEYRYGRSQTTGVMRSAAAQSLDVFHLGLDFQARPLLNQNFLEEQPPVSRNQVGTAVTQFFGDFSLKLRCARPMPTYSTPGLIDHF